VSGTENPSDPSRSFIAGHLIACSLSWGCSFLFIKLINGELPPVIIASMRALGAGAVLILAILAMRQSILPKGREWRDWLVLGTVNGWAPNILVAFALTRMDSGPAALIQASGPLMTAILGHLVLASERLTPARIAGILIGFSGVLTLIGSEALTGSAGSGDSGKALAVGAMLLMTFGYAVGSVYVRSVPKAEPLRLALGQQTVSAIVSTLLALALTGPSGYGAVTHHAVPLVALAVFSTALPIWFYMRLITRAGSTRTAMTGYLVPATAVAMGVVVLHEPVVLRQIIGGIIVLFGVAITTGLVRLPFRRTA
jgi:drug/metabolite transporter (DMT)-like permease